MTAAVRGVALGSLAGIVGFLAFVEFTSGVLQGYYTPMLTDIARHLGIHDADVNWLEGAQLMLSALVVPAFAKLGDMVGHRRMLLIATAVTAGAALVLPFTDSFIVFLAGWALMGVYVVWLPLEIALIWSGVRPRRDRAVIAAAAAGLLVAALEGGAIVGALTGGALIDRLPLDVVLVFPAVMIIACFFVILFGVKESRDLAGGRLDVVGLSLVAAALLAFTGGLGLLRLPGGLTSWWSWAVLLLGIALVVPFVRWELRQEDPVIEVRMFRSPALRPVFVTAALFGVSMLGAQAPLATFARTDPAVHGYGLGASGFATSVIIGIYLIGMIAGALAYPVVARRVSPRVALMAACVLIGIGFLLFLPLHSTYLQAIVNMMVVGIGSGALIAALPVAAASAARAMQTGVATGLSNTSKTLGGAIASCVFGIALLNGLTTGGPDSTAGSLTGYMTVWIVCSVTALVAAAVLFFVPKHTFTDQAAVQEPVG
ncbi:MFS transporter [Microbacterium sp. NPDC089321]|uniref:MFS transporter n=1 Tax=Microbacterium sp. NPDC089321 TaxID=3155183 RepID=UPI00342506EC